MTYVLITGPTASGKSSLAYALAKTYCAEVVNADSMQVYKDLNALTSRPPLAWIKTVPHHLYGFVDASTNYSVGQYDSDVSLVLFKRKAKHFIFTGGSGLYFKQLEHGLNAIPQIPDEIRDSFRNRSKSLLTEELYKELLLKDTERALSIKPTDRFRIMRALEIFSAFGLSQTKYFNDKTRKPTLSDKPLIKVCLCVDRAIHRQRIQKRAAVMLSEETIKEVKSLLAKDLDPLLPSMKAIGVQEIKDYIDKRTTYNEMQERIVKRTWAYARRQMTWFRHQLDQTWTMLTLEEAESYLIRKLDVFSSLE